MEVAIQKRQNIRFKSEAIKSRDATESQLERACHDLRRNIKATKKEIDATEIRIRDLQTQRAQLTSDLDAANKLTQSEAARLEDIQHKLQEVTPSCAPLALTSWQAFSAKAVALMRTLVFQRIVKKLEDTIAGRFRPPVHKLEALPTELAKAQARSAAIREIFTLKCETAQVERFVHSLAQLDALNVLYN